MKKNIIKFFSVLLLFLSLTSVNAFAETWAQDSSGATFYIDDNGNYQYGWIQKDNTWIYVSKWCGLHTDWLYDRNYNTYYHFNSMGVMDGQTPYFEYTDESIHSGYTNIGEKYGDSAIFFCQKPIKGNLWNIYYPSSVNQSDFLNGNVNYIYAYNTYTFELKKIDCQTGNINSL